MFFSKQQFRNFYPKLEKFTRFQNRIEIFEVDFEKPWWHILLKQKGYLIPQVLNEIFLIAFLTLIPLFLVQIFTFKRLDYFLIFGLVWAVMNLIPWFVFWSFYAPMVSQSTQSIYFSAVKYFLTVDPIFHSTRSSGQIIAKVTRGSEVFEDLIDRALFDLMKIFVGLITTIITFIFLEKSFAILACISYFIIGFFSILFRNWATQVTVPVMIQADDLKKEIGVESLSANSYIRSSFATPEQVLKIKSKSYKNGLVLATMWMSHITADMIVRMIYIVSFTLIGLFAINKIQQGFDPILAGTIMVTYYFGSRDLWTFGRFLGKFLENVQKLEDLFTFIRGFGKQSYPVLDSDLPKVKS
jgi:ABC-type multidrug transport system fused ATPase/permease subunit